MPAAPPLSEPEAHARVGDRFWRGRRLGLRQRSHQGGIDAEIWHSSHARRHSYAGWPQWRGHIGFNEVRFASRHRHFKPRVGSYIAYLTPTDLFGNVGRTRVVRFTIKPARRGGPPAPP